MSISQPLLNLSKYKSEDHIFRRSSFFGITNCAFLVLRIYVRKSQEKKFLERKPGNKNFEKKSEFSQVLGKNVTGNKVLCFGFLGFFSLNSMGAAHKVSGNKISGEKVLKKINPRKIKT